MVSCVLSTGPVLVGREGVQGALGAVADGPDVPPACTVDIVMLLLLFLMRDCRVGGAVVVRYDVRLLGCTGSFGDRVLEGVLWCFLLYWMLFLTVVLFLFLP